ncbi:hypothetical protein SE951_03245 [Escherichia coli]|nr:hypothetical protein [Escherichia coli]
MTKKEKREVRDRFVDVVLGIREVNKINKNKGHILSEQATVSEMPIVSSDVITVKKKGNQG